MSASPRSRAGPVTDWTELDPEQGQSAALLRLWRGFMAARCFVAAVLVLLQAVAVARGHTKHPLAIARPALADLPNHADAPPPGSPVGTVKARLSRGRAALAELLSDAPDTPEEVRHA